MAFGEAGGATVPSFEFDVPGQKGWLPQIGLGTASLKGERCVEACCTALKCGYRLLDTALLYGNQEAVGEALKLAAAEDKIAREQVFVTSKVSFFPPHSEGVWNYYTRNLKGGERASMELCL